MNPISLHSSKEYVANGDIFQQELANHAKQRSVLVEWLNSICPNLSLPQNASDEELKACFIDGTILCQLLNRLKPGFFTEVDHHGPSSASRSENLNKFLTAIEEMGLPSFGISDLEKGSMKSIVDCLLTLRSHFMPNAGLDNVSITSSNTKSESPHTDTSSPGHFSPISGEERKKVTFESKFQRALRSPVMSEPSTALLHHVGQKFHEVFQLKQGRYMDLPAAKISEMMKSNSLDNAPTQSLLSVVNGILDESVERKTGEIPHRVACLLRKVVQEIERRISTQAEHLRTQNNLFKAREEKYQSRIGVLEALAASTSEDIQSPKATLEEKEDEDVIKLKKQNDEYHQEISALKQEVEIAKSEKLKLEERLNELELLLVDSKNKVQELEAFSESKFQRWNVKEHSYKNFMDFQFSALKELRSFSESIKREISETKTNYSEEFNHLGITFKAIANTAENYHVLLAENKKMFNELQDLKGNIRVYCRIRPFWPGQKDKRTIIEYVGENGELVIANPSKQGKDGHRLFKFNKVFGPVSTQVEVFSDIQPLVISVLDGYNVCIFAYGQTGSGKTYTMTGPTDSSEENWGVNYRALNDIFNLSKSRGSSTKFEIGVQIVEIYNEQVRDLLSSDGLQKRLGILTQSQKYGLAVPDASMIPVKSTSDVIDLMDIGLRNRAVGATALNDRSSRSHSVVTVHVRGMDVKTGVFSHGNLHLVDLAGSERVDRSEVTGDRLKEAQHINKSLSALGDVVFALAQKSPHVPYRNSKLTQLLQSSLGGQAKTLMFVQLNPDVGSYNESLSTLKFAERVSGVELGAARSSKDGRDVRELMDQVASLKDTITKKDEEIERLQLLKDLKKVYLSINGEKRGSGTVRYGSSSPSRDSIGGTHRNQKLWGGKALVLSEKAASDHDNYSEHSDIHSEADSMQWMDDFKHQNEYIRESRAADYEERSVDIPDGSIYITEPLENLEKPKSISSLSPRSLTKSGQTSSSTVTMSKDHLKASSGIKKSGTGTGTKAPRRWQ